jgi:hypothetical protein
MVEFLFELFGELLLQALGQFLIEFGFHAIAEPFRKTPNPWIAAVGFTLMGGLCGGVSLCAFFAYGFLFSFALALVRFRFAV